MKKIILWWIVSVTAASAQAPQFSQFYANPLAINPALAGDAGLSRFIVNYRNQWPSLGTAFQTATFSFDTYHEQTGLGLGAQVLHDRRGNTLNSNQLALQVSKDIKWGESLRIVYGLQANWYSNRFNTNDLTFVSNYLTGPDPLAGDGFTANRISFSTGLLFDYEYNPDSPSLWVGGSWQNVFYRQTDDFVRARWNVQVGGRLPFEMRLWRNGTGGDLDRESALKWAVQFRNQGPDRQLDAGINWIYSPVLFGVWYRGLLVGNQRRDAIIFTGGFVYDNILFQGSYDVSVSSLGTDTGAFELSFWCGLDSMFQFTGKRSREKRARRCPRY